MKYASLFCIGALILGPLGPAGSAQESRGSIVGQIKDSSGALVSGAVVRAVNESTSVEVRTTSNDQGNYQLLFLIPGRYKISASLTGFKTWVKENVDVRVNDRIGLDIDLEVGQVAESLIVSAQTPLLQTATANTGQVVDNRRITELPLAHGNATSLMMLAPGVNMTYPAGMKWQDPLRTAQTTMMSFQGAPMGTTEFTMDGVPNTQTSNADVGSAIANSPPADAIQEFKVETAYDASVGHTSGTLVNTVIKSGTNSLHGTGYYFFRDPALNANSFFANLANQKKGHFTYKRWGLSAGAPVYIPKLYNGKNRTFFMYAYEGLHQVDTNAYTGTIPTPTQKTGNFSSLLALGSQYQIYDPLTTSPVGSGRYSRQPLPGNVIPANRISPIATAIAKYWPDPNLPGTADGTNNFSAQNHPEPMSYYNHLARVDHELTRTHRLFGRFAGRMAQFGPYRNRFDNIASGNYFHLTSKNFVLDDVWLASPSTVFNFRYGFQRSPALSYEPSRGFDLATLGFSQSLVDMLGFRDPMAKVFPTVNVAGLQGLQGEGASKRAEDIHSLLVAVDHTVGGHSLKLGADLRIYRETIWSFGSATPQFNFDATYTSGPLDNSPTSPNSIGQGFAAFLLGIPTGGFADWNDSQAIQSTYYGFYVQDNWRATSRLTLNLGLRYEYQGPVTERYNRSVRGFDFAAQQPIGAQVLANYAANSISELPASGFQTAGGLTFAGVKGEPRELYHSNKTNFAPRFGFSYQIQKDMVIRGGYGIYFLPTGQPARMNPFQLGYNLRTNIIPTTDNGQTYTASLANPFPDGIGRPPGNSLGAQTYLGQAISFFNVTPSSPYNQRWGLNVQRQLPGQFLLELGYTGSRAVALPISRSLDSTPSRFLSRLPYRDQAVIDRLSTNVANPFYPLVPGGSLASSSIPIARLLYPYPQFSGMTTTTNQGYSWFHAIEIRAERRFARGFTLQASYTHSKLMEAVAQYPRSSSYLNWDDSMPYRSIGTSDRPHNFSASGIYELPFGTGRRFGATAPSALRAIISGWQGSALWQVYSGQPLGFGDVIFNGEWNDLALSRSEHNIYRWFNTSGFETQTAKQLLYHYRTFPLYISGLRSDNYNVWDMSALKNTRIREGVSIQFRAEFLNAFNHPTFSAPNTSVTSSAFGRVTGEDTWPRYIQFGLKLIF
ncbi:MAG: TonB-dependent receptor [Bryobacterales bacterium]|nr:TonB-dependent receptor [Bryobacterales bacterium]